MNGRADNPARWTALALWGFALTLAATPAPAQAPHPIPESERWATITHPGNEAYTPPFWANYPLPMGRVDYEYQISRTEVTAGEWFEFVLAYVPYVPADEGFGTIFTSQHVIPSGPIGGPFTYTLVESARNRAVRVGWRYAARYVNWLHNAKRPEQGAFESGVYETITFGTNPDGGFTDQLTRSPGATYFIPTIDEWVKSAYWDPNRFGLGQPGYWTYPNASDTPLVPGPPGVGQTSATWSGPGPVPDVAAYLDVQSPWGLWDLSGGQSEWLETGFLRPNGSLSVRATRGSSVHFSGSATSDHINYTGEGSPLQTNGLRVARVIPAPGACLALSIAWTSLFRRRRVAWVCWLRQTHAAGNAGPRAGPKTDPRHPPTATAGSTAATPRNRDRRTLRNLGVPLNHHAVGMARGSEETVMPTRREHPPTRSETRSLAASYS